VNVSEHLNLRPFGKGHREMSCSPTGPWEIRPTGMTTEACGTVGVTGSGLRPSGKLGETPSHPTAHTRRILSKRYVLKFGLFIQRVQIPSGQSVDPQAGSEPCSGTGNCPVDA
jgi:hypothetical protein